MVHKATPEFWAGYRALPREVQVRADKQFSALKIDPWHPSLHFKKIGSRLGTELWSARVTLNYRATALKRRDGFFGSGLANTNPMTA